MDKITVYADFNFLAEPQEIGILGYEHVRGNDHFVFEYDNNPANYIYALNGDNGTHFYVEVIIVSRADLPDDVEGFVYRPLD